MKLKKFRIQHYKAIKDTGWCQLSSNMMILAGGNESGKSSILEALSDFNNIKGTMNNKAIPLSEKLTKDLSKEELPQIRLCFSVEEKELDKICKESGVNLNENAYEDILKNGLIVWRTYNTDSYDFEGKQKTIIDGVSSVGKLLAKENKQESTEQFDNSEKLLDRVKNYYLPNFILLSKFDVHLPEKIQIDNVNNNDFVKALFLASGLEIEDFKRISDNTRRKNKLNQGLKQIKKRLNDDWKQSNVSFEISPNSNELEFHFHDGDVDGYFEPVHRGKGLIVFSYILACIEASKKKDRHNILLIDEPTPYLHPRGQKNLWDILLKESEGCQIVIATHSPYFVPPKYIGNILKLKKDVDKGVQAFSINGKIEKNVKDSENRSFFFRHRDLLFTDAAIFVEGVTDFERYTNFCLDNGLDALASHFYLLKGKGAVSFFEDFCNAFDIIFFAIVDNDFSYYKSYWDNKDRRKCLGNLKKFIKDKSINCDIEKLENEIKEDISNYEKKPKGGKDDAETITVNNTEILKVKDRNIYVLQKGEIEDYLDKDGNIKDDDKKKELIAIFKEIEKGIK